MVTVVLLSLPSMLSTLLVLLVLSSLFLIWSCGPTEAMTKIRRGVGFANDANEIQVAAGVVNSAPILDYTYTYWDGVTNASCDECANKILCPHCPQYKETLSSYAVQPVIDYRERLTPGFPTAADLSPSTYYPEIIDAPFTAAVVPDPLNPIGGNTAAAAVDFEFENSRQRMGACVTKGRYSRRVAPESVVAPYVSQGIDTSYREYVGAQGYLYREDRGRT